MAEGQTSVIRRASAAAREAMNVVMESEDYTIYLHRGKDSGGERVLIYSQAAYIKAMRIGGGIPLDGALAKIVCQVEPGESSVAPIHGRSEDHNREVEELGAYLRNHGIEFNLSHAEFVQAGV